MSKIPKHEPAKRKAKPQPQPTPDYRDSSSVAEAIDGFASIFSTYVTQARNGDNGSGLYSSPGAYPVKVEVRLITEDGIDLLDGIVGTLEEQGDKQAAALERIAAAFERIADAMTARAQGS